MKIRNIHVIREGLDLTRPYTIAYKTVSAVECCFVKVEAENGMIGMGAANPSFQVVGESMDDCVQALNGLGQSFVGKDIRSLRSRCEELHELFPSQPGAKAALDIAFHDLFCQYLGISVLEFLGQKHTAMATSITIGIKGVEETLEEAEEYIGRGFRILKVKLGHSVEEDIARLRKLREKYQNKIGIRVDANQGYSVTDLQHFHQQCQQMNLELVEQPLPVAQLDEMRNMSQEIRETIAADESLVNAEDAFNLAQEPIAAGIYNIKLMKCGGIYQALRIAEVARLRGLRLMWGCNDESIVSISAALHAAFSCQHTAFIDLDGSLDLARDLVMGGFTIEDGMMQPVEATGLGLKLL